MRFRPHVASEFPNDNPALHQGARWVCLLPTAAPRAVRRPLSAELRQLTAPVNTADGSVSAQAVSATDIIAPAPAVSAPNGTMSTQSVSASDGSAVAQFVSSSDSLPSEVRREESSVPPPVATLCERLAPHGVPHDPLLDETLDEALVEVLQGMEGAAPTATPAFDSQTQSLIAELAETVASALTWELDEPAARALPAVATCAPELPSEPSAALSPSDESAARFEACDAELDRTPPKRRRAPSRGRSPRFLTSLIRDVTDPSAIAV